MESIVIDGRTIGGENKPLIIAEIGQAHEGSLGLAHSFIDAVAETGVDAIKFQTHIAHAESCKEDRFRVSFSYEDHTRYEYWKRMEFSQEQWRGLADHARSRGLIFLSTPFSIEAINLLNDLNVPAWKLGSGDFSNIQFIEAIAKTRKPIILSTGMSTYAEIANCVNVLEKYDLDYAILQCTSMYPTPLEKVGLNVLNYLQKLYKCPVGLSDHSGLIISSISSFVLGASIVEVHVTFDRRMFGPDSCSSLTFSELAQLKLYRDQFYKIKSNEVDKDAVAKELSESKVLFTRSLALRLPVKMGEIIAPDNVILKKPGIGISPSDLDKVLGKRAIRDLSNDQLLYWTDLI
jgi:N,N'-diacetyllegionaminate synthase